MLNEIERGQLCQSTGEALGDAAVGLRQFPSLLKKVIANRAWERREHREKIIELSSLRELITEMPIRGWGEDPKKIEAVIKDDEVALLMYREAMKQQGGDRRSNNTEPMSNIVRHRNHKAAKDKTGNSRAYSLDRVNRECDQKTIEAVMTGEMSPNAALVKAGVRENRQIYLPRDAAKAAAKLRERFGHAFADELRDLL